MIIGNTVRIIGEFVTWNGSHADATNPKLIIYDEMIVIATIDLTSFKIAVGKYLYDYTVPVGSRPVTFELNGILEGEPIIGRIQQSREWI